jgi:release factor glutamine methyltransferase
VPGGWLMFEHGHDQGPACAGLLAGLGYTEVEDLTDLAGLPRICLGKWPSKATPDPAHI